MENLEQDNINLNIKNQMIHLITAIKLSELFTKVIYYRKVALQLRDITITRHLRR